VLRRCRFALRSRGAAKYTFSAAANAKELPEKRQAALLGAARLVSMANF
jgi:hypothetical protein